MARIECGSVIKRVGMFPISLLRVFVTCDLSYGFAVGIADCGTPWPPIKVVVFTPLC
jgi:hypothetical protein